MAQTQVMAPPPGAPEAPAWQAPRGFGETKRRDTWWLYPLATFLGLGAFVVYATWAAFQNAHYTFGPYLSPFYSPLLWGPSSHAWFGASAPGVLAWISPAVLILWAPGGFRVTCYYYRGVYYKSFWGDPPNCAVGELRAKYLGERRFPLVLQNAHRYFLYFAVFFLIVLLHDVWEALWFTASDGSVHFGMGVGTLVLAVNVVLLGAYTCGCHSMRHFMGGRIDALWKRPARRTAYACSSQLNRWHMCWAWASLTSVAFADLYVRLCSMGIWADHRLF